MVYKLTKNADNIPLEELNNFCILNGVELDVKEREIILLEVTLK